MKHEPHFEPDGPDDEVLDQLFASKNLGGDLFAERTLAAIRADRARQRQQRLRGWLSGATGLAAAVAVLLTVGRSGGNELALGNNETIGVSQAEAALYGEMAALDDLLGPAGIFAQEENRQTLDFLIFLTKN